MNGAIEVYNQRSIADQLGANSLQSQGIWDYNSLLPYQCQSAPPRLNDFELVIEKTGSEIVLDYGAKLRLLIADPFKGIDLREAITKLKEALQNG
jgi:hypothetical protein